MKELSIEEKAKAYDELKVKAQELEEDGCFDKLTLFDLFPGLAKSEDERIRTEIIEHIVWSFNFGNCAEEKMQRWISWLEKQGEKIEPIEDFDTEFERQISHLIASIINKEYSYTEAFVKWTSDALLNYAKHEIENHGEQILANSAKTCKDEQKPIKEHDVCDFCDEKHGCVSPCPTKLIEKQKPADKVDQHSLPVSDNSSLPTFDESIYHPCTEEVHEQKPAWGEEDELTRKALINLVEMYYGGCIDKSEKNRLLDFLKSLRPQKQWKPSEEQMYNLSEAAHYNCAFFDMEILKKLYDDLKQLKDV